MPPTFSSLYEITLLEKRYEKHFGEATGKKKIESLIKRKSINPETETRDIKTFVDEVRREQQDRKRQTKEELLWEKDGSKGYVPSGTYRDLKEMISEGAKTRSIALEPPDDLVTKWSDVGVLNKDIAIEFPISEVRGKSERQPINIFILVHSSRIDVAIKILRAGGFSYRDTFFSQKLTEGLSSAKSEKVLVVGQRGKGGGIVNISSPNTGEVGMIEVAENAGNGPYLLLFSATPREGWICLPQPI